MASYYTHAIEYIPTPPTAEKANYPYTYKKRDSHQKAQDMVHSKLHLMQSKQTIDVI